MVRVFARPGESFQQLGGDCPEGCIHMVEERPGVDHVASADGQWIPAPPRVPEAVTALQGMLALNQAGHLQAVEVLFQADDTPLPHRLAYQRAQAWQRTSPTVAYMQARMGWTDAFVDQLFRDAEKVI